MGAMQFTHTAKGKTAKDAFTAAVEEARYDFGNAGYTGTIAEKYEFKIVSPAPGESVSDAIERMANDPNHFSDDKWEPAAAIKSGEDEWTFFGWASS